MILILISASDRPGLLRDVANILTNSGSNILFSYSIVEDGRAKLFILVDNVDQGIKNRIIGVRGVEGVEIIDNVDAVAYVIADLGSKYPEIVVSLFKLLPTRFSAWILELMNRHARIAVARLLPQEKLVEILSEAATNVVVDIIEGLWPDTRKLIAKLPSDKLDDVIRNVEPRIARLIIESLPPENRKIIESLLKYPPESIASVMRTRIPKIDKNARLIDALNIAKFFNTDIIFVVDHAGYLVGELHISDAISANPDTPVSNLVKRPRIVLRADMDKEKAIRSMIVVGAKVAPVVDESNKLIGSVFIEDVMDVVVSEYTEDVLRLEAIYARGHLPYFSITPIKWTLLRLPGLMLVMLIQFLTSGIILGYEDVLASIVISAAFIPLIMDTAGNVGTQVSTIIVRSLATGDVSLTPRSFMSVMMREAITGILMGAILALVGSAIVLIISKSFEFALTVMISLTIVVFVLNLVSAMLPIVFTLLNIDPAVASGPLITTIGDIIGLTIYFTVIRLFLG